MSTAYNPLSAQKSCYYKRSLDEGGNDVVESLAQPTKKRKVRKAPVYPTQISKPKDRGPVSWLIRFIPTSPEYSPLTKIVFPKFVYNIGADGVSLCSLSVDNENTFSLVKSDSEVHVNGTKVSKEKVIIMTGDFLEFKTFDKTFYVEFIRHKNVPYCVPVVLNPSRFLKTYNDGDYSQLALEDKKRIDGFYKEFTVTSRDTTDIVELQVSINFLPQPKTFTKPNNDFLE